MTDDNSPPVKEWFVADCVCGFGWVVVRADFPERDRMRARLVVTFHIDDGRGDIHIWHHAGGAAQLPTFLVTQPRVKTTEHNSLPSAIKEARRNTVWG